MTDDEQLTSLTVQIDAGPDADREEIERLTYRLRNEIKDLDVDSIELVSSGPVPDHAKAVDGVAPGTMALSLRPSILADLISVLRGWVERGDNRRIEIAFQLADVPVVIKALPNDLPVALNALAGFEQTLRTNPIARPAPVSRSGGADLTADQIDVGGDVVGRDKIMSAGGHLIIAKEGSTVIIADNTTSPALKSTSTDD